MIITTEISADKKEIKIFVEFSKKKKTEEDITDLRTFFSFLSLILVLN